MRRTVLICATFMTALLVGIDLIADLFLRQVPGSDAESWDVAASVAIGLWVVLMFRSWRTSRYE